MSEGQAGTAKKSGAPDPLLGRVIAERFKIVSLIARGGMGKVYRAEQAPLGRLCAVKVLNPNYSGDADPEFHRRFFREASVASKITHPNSVTIFDYGKTDDEILYMAMEYLEGQTLHQAIRDGGVMNEERVGRIAQQICRALREAHVLGVIHRDLKPANIFLTRHGDDADFVKVLDFGLVKHIGERPEEQLTQTGLFMGSPKYMAPEQIQGGHVDARTDVYSLGIILYEMLAGKVPFDRATSVNILMAHVGEPPPPMREVNPYLVCSPTFEELVMRCIAKDPAQRYHSMDEVLQAIKRAHGAVSLSGQLAAMNMTGPFAPLATNPPPPVAGVASASGSIPPPAVVSGPHSVPPPRPLYTTGQHEVLDTFEPPSRSKGWIAIGVLAAAAVGGGLGMVAFRMTAPETNGAAASALVAPAAAPTEASTTPPPTSTTEPVPRVIESVVPLKVTTDPAGVLVREDNDPGCETPCEVGIKGAGPHKLTFSKAGYRSETRTVKQGDAPIFVRLWKFPSNATPAKPTLVAPPNPPPAPPKPEPTTPSGFKDLPY